MKKLLVLAALSMAAAPAMASKARLNALGNSEQLKDTQTIFTRPSDLAGLGNWATAELGATPTLDAKDANGAEGGFARSYGEGYLGFYLGHRGVATATRSELSTAATTLIIAEENPIEVYYAAKAGDITWGASLWYSKSDKKAAVTQGADTYPAGTKASSMGVRGSMEMGAIDAYVHVGITDTAEDGTNKYKGGTPITLGGGYTMDNAYIFAEVATIDGKVDAGAGDNKFKGSDYKLGYINSTKSEGSNFFWGIAYQGHNRGGDLGTAAYTMLPFWIGVEQEAASWLTLRASVKQNTILGSYKSGTEWNTTDNNTTASAGVGLKWNKVTLDAAIAANTLTAPASNKGSIVGDNLLTNVAVTYLF